MRKTVTAAGSSDCEVTLNAAIPSPVLASPSTRVPGIERSASRPPTTVPSVMPTPNRPRTSGTVRSGKPDTSVSVGVM